MNDYEILRQGAEKMGISLSADQIERYRIFTEYLLEINSVMNLTAITELPEIMTKHYLDSLTLVQTELIGKNAAVIDVGCGAGFPGFPLKLARTDIKLTLLDSLRKRINFLTEACAKCNISDTICVHMRAEEGGKQPKMREKYDVAVSRAVASLPVLSELCLPFVKKGGYFLAMKGPEPESEIAEAKDAIRILGGTVKKVIHTDISDTDLRHSIIVIEKTAPTPAKYPRISAKIGKEPIK